mgnify:CR=1 FL=1
MRDWIIETKHLTKKYGNQTAVRDVNLHVEKDISMVCWDVTVQERQRL